MTFGWRILRLSGLALLGITAGLILMVRLAPMPPALWHIDPTSVQKAPKGNDFVLRPFGAAPDGADGIAALYQGDAATLALHLYQTAMAEPHTTMLDGNVTTGFFTVVQRSKWMGFPDVISVRTSDAGPGRASLAIWSRSRYGAYDWGVNRARVERWLAANQRFLVVPTTPPAASP